MRLRLPSVVLTVLALLVLTACTRAITGKGSTPPKLDPLPADQVVVSVDAGLGYVPQLVVLLSRPWLVIYGDGRVYRLESPYGKERKLLLAKVDPVELASFVSRAENSGLFQASYGDPQITDLGHTTVTVHGYNGKLEVGVYALYQGDDVVTPKQRKNRLALRALIDEAEALADAGGPVLPDRVEVLSFQASDKSSDPAAWPGPPPEAFLSSTSTRWSATGCGILGGVEAETAWSAAATNTTQTWLLPDGSTAGLAVRPLLPGEPECAG